MRGINQMLRFGKGTQAHRAAADLTLDALQPAGRAESPHRFDGRIKKTEKKQAQIVVVSELPLGVVKTAVQLALAGRSLQGGAKIFQQSPMTEILFRNGWIALTHLASQPEGQARYKLQSGYGRYNLVTLVRYVANLTPAKPTPNTTGRAPSPGDSLRADAQS